MYGGGVRRECGDWGSWSLGWGLCERFRLLGSLAGTIDTVTRIYEGRQNPVVGLVFVQFPQR